MTELIVLSTIAGAAASYPLLRWGLSRETALEKIEKAATRYMLPVSLAMAGVLLLILYTPAYIGVLSVITLLLSWAAVQIREYIKNNRESSKSVLLDTVSSSEVSRDLTERRGIALNGFLIGIFIAVLITESLIADIPGFVSRYPQMTAFIGGKRVVPGLVDSLNNKDRNLRGHAAAALIELGEEKLLTELAETAVPALNSVLEYRGWQTRSRAEKILIDIGPAAVSDLIEAFEDRRNNARIDIARILGKIGDNRAVPPLLNAIWENDKELRKWVASSLGQIKDPSAVPHLVRVLGNPEASLDLRSRVIVTGELDLQLLVLGALGEIGHVSAVPAIVPWLKANDEDVRIRAAKALGMIGDPSAIPALIEVLKGDDLKLHSTAAEAMGSIGGEEAVIALTEAMSTKDINLRMRIVSALGETRSRSAGSVLLDLVNEGEVEIRRIAVLALGRLGDRSQLPNLLTALQDNNPLVRRAAAIALGELKDDRAVPALIEVLKTAPSAIQMEAAYSLGKIRSPLALNGLIESLKAESETARIHAADVLGDMANLFAASALRASLNDSSPRVVASAARALGRMGDTSAISAIKAVHKGHYGSPCPLCGALQMLETK